MFDFGKEKKQDPESANIWKAIKEAEAGFERFVKFQGARFLA